MFDFFEFFAGGGMVRAGLGAEWRCRFANDFDAKKSAVYRRNWRDGVLKTADVRALTTKDLHGAVDLAWASFPCRDLSLAGGGAGLKGDRSVGRGFDRRSRLESYLQGSILGRGTRIGPQ
jgi:DNA (cytosine-5)-methyltransferase 1